MASREAIEIWLLERLGQLLGVPASMIEIGEPFDQYGLSSRDAVGLSGDLEQWLDRTLPATLFYDYPSVKALSSHLSGETAEPQSVNGELPPQLRRETGPIAVVGMACRFPKAANLAAFWRLLSDGADAVGETPKDRWEVNDWSDSDMGVEGGSALRWGGYIEGVDRFDAEFFGIPPREAASMDPQQRMLLEVSWEALENAGIAPDLTSGHRVGAYVGICGSDYAGLQSRSAEYIDAYTGSGNAHSVASNRLAYFYDWRGPSFAIDAACASSLVAVHEACRALNEGDCDMALAGGVNAILAPETTLALSRARMLAADGRCKTFDAKADGYVRGEGCGFVVLKRLTDAERAGDIVWAILRGTAVNHSGRSNGLTAPSGRAQQAVIRHALARASVSAVDVGFVECQGTGTALGDAIEVGALGAVLNDGGPRIRECYLGAVKTNIGHLEGAAGIAGLIKTVLAFREGQIPSNLHYKTANPDIELDGLRLPTERVRWSGESPRVALVNSFGFGGVNCAAVVEETARRTEDSVRTPPDAAWRILVLTAKTDAALRRHSDQFARFLDEHHDLSLRDICHSANTGRTHLAHRLAVLARDRAGFSESLRGFALGNVLPGVMHSIAGTDRKPHVGTAALVGNAWTVEERKTMLMSLASLFVSGVSIDWQLVASGGKRVLLPTYPFEPARHWFTERAARRLGHGASSIRGRGRGHFPIRSMARESRSTAVLDRLRDLTAQALGVETGLIKENANLVELGVDSLMLMEITAELEEEFGIELNRETFFLEPTLCAQADAVVRALDSDSRAVVSTGGNLVGWLDQIEEGNL